MFRPRKRRCMVIRLVLLSQLHCKIFCSNIYLVMFFALTFECVRDDVASFIRAILIWRGLCAPKYYLSVVVPLVEFAPDFLAV